MARSQPSRSILAVLASLALGATLPAGALGAQAGPAALAEPLPALVIPPLSIDTFSLENGLTVIVSEDRSTPLVAVNMWYRVGSAHEEVGRSGFAHLFEHMLFEETENLAAGEMDRLVSRAGGVYNGTTNTDRTAYYEVVPSNRVNLAFWLHAERMARLRVSEENFQTQREVVKEERRQRVDNQPYAEAQLTVDTVAQRDYAPYRHTVIGSMADLDAAEVGDVLAFYRRYYAPNHAVLTVVGDVSTEQVRELALEYFGDIARGPEVPALPDPPAVPRTDGERRVELEDPLAQLPLVWMAYNLPPTRHPDHAALALMAQVFSTGQSSRLRRRLVDEEQAALDVIAQVDRRLGPGLILFGALPNQGVSIERVEALVQEEIELLQDSGIGDGEMAKALNQVRAAAVTGRLTAESKASLLQSYNLHHGSPFAVNDEMARYEAVTADDIRRVARTYLVPANRTVVVARPTAGPGGQGGRP
jgi:predicted Zn-dependent peptidase